MSKKEAKEGPWGYSLKLKLSIQELLMKKKKVLGVFSCSFETCTKYYRKIRNLGGHKALSWNYFRYSEVRGRKQKKI